MHQPGFATAVHDTYTLYITCEVDYVYVCMAPYPIIFYGEVITLCRSFYLPDTSSVLYTKTGISYTCGTRLLLTSTQ